jgi:uncharacterized protein YcbK (DUF882 family)
MNRKKLSVDFFEDEFWSPDTNTCKMSHEFIYKLQKLRTIVGVKFLIAPGGGYRTEEYNARMGGAADSKHKEGIAVDIDHTRWDGVTRLKFIAAASALGFSIGIYPKHFHVDTRSDPKVLWVSLYKKKSSL